MSVATSTLHQSEPTTDHGSRIGLRRDRARALFAALSELEPGSREHVRVREELVELHLPLVRFFARRYAGRGEPMDDLVQVGSLGLIKAIDRFQPERGLEFSTYASPTVLG